MVGTEGSEQTENRCLGLAVKLFLTVAVTSLHYMYIIT